MDATTALPAHVSQAAGVTVAVTVAVAVALLLLLLLVLLLLLLLLVLLLAAVRVLYVDEDLLSRRVPISWRT